LINVAPETKNKTYGREGFGVEKRLLAAFFGGFRKDISGLTVLNGWH
jgi:hypothetical protein